jgi:hypothetical protein
MAFARGWRSSRKPSRLSSWRFCLIKAKVNESPGCCQRLISGYGLGLKQGPNQEFVVFLLDVHVMLALECHNSPLLEPFWIFFYHALSNDEISPYVASIRIWGHYHKAILRIPMCRSCTSCKHLRESGAAWRGASRHAHRKRMLVESRKEFDEGVCKIGV